MLYFTWLLHARLHPAPVHHRRGCAEQAAATTADDRACTHTAVHKHGQDHVRRGEGRVRGGAWRFLNTDGINLLGMVVLCEVYHNGVEIRTPQRNLRRRQKRVCRAALGRGAEELQAKQGRAMGWRSARRSSSRRSRARARGGGASGGARPGRAVEELHAE
jgi:hypothetical protein